MKHIHILGIGGTFMAGLALIAKQKGYTVSGNDLNLYPPMSTQLEEQGIVFTQGYDPQQFPKNVDCVIVGNVIKRGNALLEYIMTNNIAYTSGPEWLYNHVLRDQWVLAVAGTHGKTTTSSLLAWILEFNGYQPNFLIGGIPQNFGVSARISDKKFFVVEADEYDSAFFDKRSKFLHYRPKTSIFNNLEFDHADIFPNLDAIKLQFHHLVKTIPSNGQIIYPATDANILDVLTRGCWSEKIAVGGDDGYLSAEMLSSDGSKFVLKSKQQVVGETEWQLLGNHNIQNALTAIAAAMQIGIPAEKALNALPSFKNVKRRLELKGQPNNVTIYDDFAHHPTAISTTLAALRARIGAEAKLVAVLEFGSYTMRHGVHKADMANALKHADQVIFKNTELDWGLQQMIQEFKQPTTIYNSVEQIVNSLSATLNPGNHVIIMSNSGFDGLHEKLISALEDAVT